MNYNKVHAVMLVFKRLTSDQDHTARIRHANYYRQLSVLAKTLYYGEVMNEQATCAIIQVSSDLAFEQVIANDPELNSGLYDILRITPFAAQNLN